MAHDPYRVALEVREQLSSGDRRVGFLLGAGTSMALGIPGIVALTEKVQEVLQGINKSSYQNLRSDIGETCTVEDVLSRVRLYRELIGDSETKEYEGIKGAGAARGLDASICQAIAEIVKKSPKEPRPHATFAHWIGALHTRRNSALELFTTNYDLFLEEAFESAGVPFFDGFVGSVNPFFAPECVEAEDSRDDAAVFPPRGWTRLWKLHGSTNWKLTSSGSRITRGLPTNIGAGEELVVFPSRQKYSESRKLPFLTFQDRLRRFVARGECLLIVIGYSFSDEHLNALLFQGLRGNPRLAVNVLVFGNVTDKMTQFAQQYWNLSIYGCDKAVIGGVPGDWSDPSEPRDDWPFWDVEAKAFTLGDFSSFAQFLEKFIGFRYGSSEEGK